MSAERPIRRYTVKSFDDTQRTVDDIVREIDALKDRVAKSEGKRDTGIAGDMRIVQIGSAYYLEVRHNDGWLRSTAFSFMERSE